MHQINLPELWIESFPVYDETTHKYKRGQVFVLGGVEMTGAACLSADAAARVGAGLVTIISPYLSAFQKLIRFDPIGVYKSFKPYIMVKQQHLLNAVQKSQEKGRCSVIIGPGLGNREYSTVRSIVYSILEEKTLLVLDADGLNAFEGRQAQLYTLLHEDSVVTPHEGEFKKLFPELSLDSHEDRIQSTQLAAKKCGCVIVLKGARTIIANEHSYVINTNAKPSLATAGSGDVLSGIIAGLMAQGMDAFDAARCGVWIHGKTSQTSEPCLVATDINEKIPLVLKEMLGIDKKLG
ncbi:MAG: NAD(P)H-hydrate dehydratase [Alphaproteobacteria bacterium]